MRNIEAMNQCSYLSEIVIRKIIAKILLEKKLTFNELAQLLHVNSKKLELLMVQEDKELIQKINLPLIKLFCATKFNC